MSNHQRRDLVAEPPHRGQGAVHLAAAVLPGTRGRSRRPRDRGRRGARPRTRRTRRGARRPARCRRASRPPRTAACPSNSSTVQPLATAWSTASANRARASSSPRQSIGVGDAQSRRGRDRQGRRRRSAREHVEQCRGVGHGRGEHGDAVERAPWPGPRRRWADTPGVGFSADDAAQRGGDATRTGGVGAERERRPRRSRPRPPTRSSNRPRCTSGSTRVAARPVLRRAGADQAGGELVEVGLARRRPRRHRAGAARPAPMRVGHVRERRAGGGGRHAGDVDVVLHRERHAGEREVGPRGEPGVDLGDAAPAAPPGPWT